MASKRCTLMRPPLSFSTFSAQGLDGLGRDGGLRRQHLVEAQRHGATDIELGAGRQ
jgi:hypothetical protein